MKRFFSCIKILIIAIAVISNTAVINAQINWLQTGADIDGIGDGDNSGDAVSLNSDGSIVAIGAYHADDGAKIRAGSVMVYENNSGTWVQKGQTLYGPNAFDIFGKSVALSSDGSVLVASSALYPGGNGQGLVRVFEYNSGIWVQVGTDIIGDNVNHQTGWSVSINDAGTIIAIGENVYDDGVIS